MTINNLLLDYDGFVLNYEEPVWAIFKKALIAAGTDFLKKSVHEVEEEDRRIFNDPRPNRRYSMPFFEGNYDDPRHLEFYLAFHDAMDHSWKKQHACEVRRERFKAILKAGCGIHFYSNGSSGHVQRGLEYLGLQDLIPTKSIIGLDVVGLNNCKRNPDAFPLVADLLGINPQTTLFGEDSIHNLEFAAEAGFQTAFVDWTGVHKPSPYDQFISQGERYNSFDEFLLNQLKKLQ